MARVTVLTSALDALEKAINCLAKMDYPIGKIRAIYAEIYVANKLAAASPQLGKDRDVKSADIYLSKSRKSVEVKASEKGSMSGEADWCWAISPRQLKEKKFDYCVMIGFDDKQPLKITKELVFSYKDFEGEPFEREDFMRNYAGVCYYRKSCTGNLTNLERQLMEHPENYEGRYDRIRQKTSH